MIITMADKEVSEPIHEKNANINVLSLASGGVFNPTILSKVHDYLLMVFCLFSIGAFVRLLQKFSKFLINF